MSKITNLMLSAMLAGLLLGTQACSSHSEDGHHHTLADVVKEYTEEPAHGVTSEKHVESLKKMLADVQGADTFYVAERAVHMASFPCSNCHTAPLNELKAGAAAGEKKAHWNIDLKHAHMETMDCATCHNTEGDMDKLVSLTDRPISVDQSYKQCAQCHSSQYKDWVGGSHGKRLKSWAQPRVINNCTSCHNPHSPAFDKRWPARLNTAKAYPETTD